MKPVYQTRFGSPGGNCFQACIASIFELSLECVPDFCNIDGDWWQSLQEFLSTNFNLCAIAIDKYPSDIRNPSITIITGNSPRNNGLHSVVGCGDKIVHDPHPDSTGLLDKQDVIVFCPISLQLRKD
jgi:hypothetical protein